MISYFWDMLIFLFRMFMLVFLISQANPEDPGNFPFILLGNKIDIDGGNSRVVRR